MFNCLLNCTNLTSIGAYSFSSSELETIVFPDSVTTFSKCSFAAKNIKAFPFPLNLKSIPYLCFLEAKSFLNVSFKSNSKITTIENEAFIYAGVRYVHLPASVTSLSSAFTGCNLETITIDAKNQNYSVYSNVVLTKDNKTVVFGAYSQTCFELPSTVETIIMGAFRETLMKDLKLNHGLKNINSWSMGASKIEKIEIPSTVMLLGDSAFKGCSLQNITFLGPLQTLKISVFENCRMMERITLPSELESISQKCFFGCSKLSYVWIPKTVMSIKGGAFLGIDPNCDLVFESGSTIIKERDILYTKDHRSLVAFLGFSGRTEIEVHPDCTDIASLAFSAMPVTSVDISKCRIRSIGSGAFSESALVNFSMSDETDALEEKTFLNCKNLTSVRLSRNLSSIGPECFSGCTSLESISIPPSVLAIGERCFRGASKLASVTFEEESRLRTIENEAFAATDIRMISFPPTLSSCGASILSGSSVSAVYLGRFDNRTVGLGSISIRMLSGCPSLKDFDIDGVEEICEYAFANCTSIETFSLAASVKKVHPYAFEWCVSLSQFNIPKGSLESIDNRCFSKCSSLRSLTVSLSNTRYVSVDGCLFDIDATTIFMCLPAYDRTVLNLTAETYGRSLKAIGIYSVQGCANIETVVLPDTVESIGMYAFDGCSRLAHINIPAGVESIGVSAFRGCVSFGCDGIIFEAGKESIFADSEVPSVALIECPSLVFSVQYGIIFNPITSVVFADVLTADEI